MQPSRRRPPASTQRRASKTWPRSPSDPPRQEQVYDNLAWNREPRYIRHRMMESHVPSSDRRVVFVGMDAYAAAGGAVVHDLFSEEGDGYIEDAALLDRLTLEQLNSVA